ncbi:MAG: tRNA epoxyqueuosine(34) reductase QueG [Mariprofundus sp.]|nr:tRNA epoxyqueuosine(34) reductase QueG [Mariprofundus sp.]
MDSDKLKASIHAKASEYGFRLCRVTRPEVGSLHGEALQNWVESGMHGDMIWMAEDVRLQRRKSPESMLEGVQSIITVAMPYTAPPYSLEKACAVTGSGVITAYAHGDDYHDLMKKRLKALAASLDRLPGNHDQRIFVDTAPVLEHALAESAGLGWQGKHSLTIHRDLGSWFLLGEIFTTLEIEPDKPATNHCGTCSACMDICPTKAIVAPYVVDARLCISYLTIEFDGFIPRYLRPLMGNRIYGCDDCQMVCPWNSYATNQAATIDDLKADPLRPRGENNLPDLASLLHLDEDQFRQRFRKSPIRRTKRRGLLRNVCIAMGNSGYVGFVGDLMQVLGDNEALIRGHAIWALGCLANEQNMDVVIETLNGLLDREDNCNVLEEISISIENIRGKYGNT